MRRLLVAAMVISLTIFLLIQACDKSTAPVPEILSSFSLTVPTTVTTGELFSLTVRAVGTEGTRPFSEFNGYVELTASGGSITPDSLLLTGGIASGQVIISGQSDSQTITATHGSIKGSVTVNATLMTALPGNPGDPANEAIPAFEYIASGDDFSDNHPVLPGMYISSNTILVAFELGTTVSQANTILDGIDAKIIGGITGEEGVAPGVLFLKLPPATTHAELETILSALNANSAVQTAVQDIMISPNSVPKPNDGDPADWTWSTTPAGPNWALERIRVPQMWNFNDAVAKKLAVGQWPPTRVLIVDVGFVQNHPDLNNLYANPFVEDPHGAHIAGIIGATFNNGKGIDGISPYVYMYGHSIPTTYSYSPHQGRASVGQAIISGLHHGMRPYIDVVNMSLGYNWVDVGIDSDTDAAAQSICISHAILLFNIMNLGTLSIQSPLIVVSAGNGSGQAFGDHDALFNSPMCYAALGLGVQNILIVEGVMDSPGTADGDVTRYPSSSIQGHISAPGSDVWGTTSEAAVYRSRDGTSYAAAVVSGVAAYLYAIEPNLNFLEVKDVLLSTALSSGGGAQPRIDAWASVVDLDRVRGDNSFLTMMCDIDDGTPDGNLRVNYRSQAYYAEDVDGDQGIGDGTVDMSDFRRWRDWFLFCNSVSVRFDLDGEDNHPKKDVNHNGTVESATAENIYPRGDFNGDGQLDESETSFVPGVINGDATDLEVFQAVFDDPDYDAGDLPGLLYSADLQVDASELLLSSSNVYAEISQGLTHTFVASHTFTPGKPVHVFTVPYHYGGYRVDVYADGEEYEHGERNYNVVEGDDIIFKPIAYIPLVANATYLHTCDDPAPSTVPISLAALGIQPGNVVCLDNEGYFTYTNDPDSRSSHLIAVFSSSATIEDGSFLHRIPGAIDAHWDITTWQTKQCDRQDTDIPEDFEVIGNGVITEVPAGAKYLFVCGLDCEYYDNMNPSGRFGIQISIIKAPPAILDD